MKFEFRETQDVALAGTKPADPAPEQGVRRLEFDLPNKLLAGVVATGAAYLAIMYVAFRAGTGLALIFVVFGLVLVAYYGLPLMMQQVSGAKRDEMPRRGAWGIDTASGYLSGRAAFAQVMTVPLLMVAWALFVSVIA
jgi:phage shock protein PspC (stress-responsive transcriptional regulator)